MDFSPLSGGEWVVQGTPVTQPPGRRDSVSNKRKHGSLGEAHVFLAVSFRGNLSLESLEGILRERWALPAHVAHIY